MNTALWYAGVAILGYFHLIFILAAIFRRNDLADVAWGPGFMIGAIAGWMASEDHPLNVRAVVAFSLAAIWALRLGWHVGRRNLSHSREDARYANWRRQWGDTWLWRSYLQVFVLQAVILWVIDLSVLWILTSPTAEFDLFCYVGAGVWIMGFLFETIGDRQLHVFKKDPENRGKLITTGLWSWSRHPNYFGEVAQWWGLFLMSVSLPLGWITVLSPIAITYLILKVSGVTMLEDLMKQRTGFEEYKRTTSKFFPLPPRKSASS